MDRPNQVVLETNIHVRRLLLTFRKIFQGEISEWPRALRLPQFVD